MSDRRLHARLRAPQLLLAAALAAAAPWACAQESGQGEGDSERDWNLRGGVTAMSDYVWRGVSQTQEDPAL